MDTINGSVERLSNAYRAQQASVAVTTLQQACRALSSVCDGAHSLDGHGFNGCDTDFGKSLAAKDSWTPRMAIAAQKMLRKYSKQLLGFGINIGELPVLDMDNLQQEQPAQQQRAEAPRRLELKGTRVHIFFPYNPAEKDAVKTMAGYRFESAATPKHWSIPVQRNNARAFRDFIDAWGYELPDDVRDAYRALKTEHESREVNVPAAAEASALARAAQPAAAVSEWLEAELKGFGVELFPFQKAGVAYALLKQRCIIGDDMGLGKTMQALATAYVSGAAQRMVVVCPASVKLNWQREIKRAIPALNTVVWEGGKHAPVNASTNVVILNYDILGKHIGALLKFAPLMVVLDEVHYCKNGTAARTKAAAQLVKHGSVEYVLGLSGTPIINRPAEFATPLAMLGYLGHFGGWQNFVTRYCGAYTRIIRVRTKQGQLVQRKIWDTSGATNLQELNAKLSELCMVRRRKSEVLTDLPSKTRVQLVLDIDNRSEYEEAAKSIKDYMRAVAADDKAFLATLKGMNAKEREQAILQHMDEAGGRAERAEMLVLFNTLKQLASRGKFAAAREWITDFLETGEKLVVFADHQEFQYGLLAEFPNAARIIAEDGAEQRQAQIDRFRTDASCKLMVASLGAGGTGVNGLQEVCSNVAFMELGWTPAVHLQAEDRCYRIGQASSVTAYYLLAANTIEEEIQSMLAGKQAVCDSALDGADETKSGSIFNELLTAMMEDAAQ